MPDPLLLIGVLFAAWASVMFALRNSRGKVAELEQLIEQARQSPPPPPPKKPEFRVGNPEEWAAMTDAERVLQLKVCMGAIIEAAGLDACDPVGLSAAIDPLGGLAGYIAHIRIERNHLRVEVANRRRFFELTQLPSRN